MIFVFMLITVGHFWRKRLNSMLWGFSKHTCASLCRLLKVLWCPGPTQDPCVSFCYISPMNTLCSSLMMSFFGSEGVVGKGKQAVEEIWAFMFCTTPSAELRWHHSSTLWQLASPSAHNASSWGILWGGGATEPWNHAGIHYHQRSALSSLW